jgi:hypothetical protein
MTLAEWAARLDELAAGERPGLPGHEARADGNPAWSANGRTAWVRVAEDDATLRAFFVPRDRADAAIVDEERSTEKTYVRSDAGAREAARDIAHFLNGPAAG